MSHPMFTALTKTIRPIHPGACCVLHNFVCCTTTVGAIVKANGNDTFEVLYSDGDTEYDVALKNLRHLSSKPDAPQKTSNEGKCLGCAMSSIFLCVTSWSHTPGLTIFSFFGLLFWLVAFGLVTVFIDASCLFCFIGPALAHDTCTYVSVPTVCW